MDSKNGMSVSGTITLACVGFVAVFLAYAISVKNDCARTENQLKAVFADSKNVHSSFTLGLQTQGLAVEKYGELVVKACEATYGQGGAKAAVLLLQKQNPDIDSSVVARLQVAIEAGYARFEQVQRSKIDVVRVYRNKLDTFPVGNVAAMFGYPRCDLAKLEEIVTSAGTKKAFEQGEMEAVNPFGK